MMLSHSILILPFYEYYTDLLYILMSVVPTTNITLTTTALTKPNHLHIHVTFVDSPLIYIPYSEPQECYKGLAFSTKWSILVLVVVGILALYSSLRFIVPDYGPSLILVCLSYHNNLNNRTVC